MKFKSYLFAGLAAFVLSACDEDFGSWPEVPVNPQEEVADFTDATVSNATASAEAAAGIDFAAIAAGTELVKVANVTAPTSSDPSYVPTYQIVLDDKSTFDLTADGEIKLADLQEFVVANYGKAPVMNEISAVVVSTLSNGQSSFRYISEPFVIKAQPDAPFIDTAYYLVGDMLAWNAEGMKQFSHSSQGVYDDPIFTITFTTTADNQYWKIIPQTNVDGDFWAEGETGVVGVAVDGDTSLEGNLVTASPQAGKIETAGIYRLTIDMMNYKYTIEKLNFGEFIYEIGNETGWSTVHALRGADFDGKYQGYYYLDGEFKFKPNADDWNGDWEYDGEGKIADNGGSNMPGVEGGFYRIDVDLAAMTYATKKIDVVSIIGTANGNWDTDTDLTYNKEEGCWEVTTDLSAGEMKFRGNHNWDGDVDLGGSFDNLVHGGSNIAVEAGNYTIKLYISYAGAHKAVVTKN